MTGVFDALLRYEIDLWNVLDDEMQRGHGVSLGRFQALRVLRDRGGQARVQDVAGDLAITVGAASKVVDRLERDGAARRQPNPDDRRSSLIALTPAGLGLLEAGSSTFDSPGPPEVLEQRSIPIPSPELGEVLMRVKASGFTAAAAQASTPP